MDRKSPHGKFKISMLSMVELKRCRRTWQEIFGAGILHVAEIDQCCDPQPRSWLQGVADRQRKCLFSKEPVIAETQVVRSTFEEAAAVSLAFSSGKSIFFHQIFEVKEDHSCSRLSPATGMRRSLNLTPVSNLIASRFKINTKVPKYLTSPVNDEFQPSLSPRTESPTTQCFSGGLILSWPSAGGMWISRRELLDLRRGMRTAYQIRQRSGARISLRQLLVYQLDLVMQNDEIGV
jgi:hypothetical protein